MKLKIHRKLFIYKIVQNSKGNTTNKYENLIKMLEIRKNFAEINSIAIPLFWMFSFGEFVSISSENDQRISVWFIELQQTVK